MACVGVSPVYICVLLVVVVVGSLCVRIWQCGFLFVGVKLNVEFALGPMDGWHACECVN